MIVVSVFPGKFLFTLPSGQTRLCGFGSFFGDFTEIVFDRGVVKKTSAAEAASGGGGGGKTSPVPAGKAGGGDGAANGAAGEPAAAGRAASPTPVANGGGAGTSSPAKPDGGDGPGQGNEEHHDDVARFPAADDVGKGAGGRGFGGGTDEDCIAAVTLDPNEGRKAAVTCMEYGQLYVMEKEDLIAFTKTVPRLRLLSWGGVCFE